MIETTKTIIVEENGGPENMQWKDIEIAPPSDTQVRIRHTFVGLNYIDTYHRSGLYPLQLPSGLGMEAAGIITHCGENISNLKVGDRVCYIMQLGSYSQSRNLEEEKVIKIPDAVSDQEAAAAMLKGMTVEYLTERLFEINNSHTVLFHAVAGGVGLIACQWLKEKGAKIIGTVGSEEKASVARKHGCDEVILYKEDDFVEKVKNITENKGVDVVYDGVGKDTAIKGLDCLKPLGTMVVFGNSSGNCPPVDPSILAAKGSLFFTRPTLMTYASKKKDYIDSSNRVFEMLIQKKISLTINEQYSLSNVVNAHKDLEERKTTGSIVMINDY